MKYQYKCPTCNTETTVDKPIKHKANYEYCEECKNELERVYDEE